MKPISIIIADDHQLFIDGLKSLLNKEEDFKIIDIANTGKELLDILETKVPNLILLDINMPKMNGLEALQRIRTFYEEIKIVILSTYYEDHLIKKAKSLGANGYMLKTISKDELLKGIHEIMNGNVFFQSKTALRENLNTNDSFIKHNNLTTREVEILHLLGKGMTNKAIADQLYLSLYTVETHRKNVMQKLELKNPASLIRYIIENEI